MFSPHVHVALGRHWCNRKSAAKCLSAHEFAKIPGDVWFKVEVPRGNTTEDGGVNNCPPHDGMPKHVRCPERGRIRDYQNENRHHEMTRPRSASAKAAGDQSHKAANYRDEWGGDMQPFGASHSFAAHKMWADVQNRERNRQEHSHRRECREPGQDSNGERSIHLTQLICPWRWAPSNL